MENQIQKIVDSGFIPLYKGEPPFMPYKGGHGFMGVVLQHQASGKIQCHLCGGLYENVLLHVRTAHKKFSALKFRTSIGVNRGTPLCSPKVSESRARTWVNLTPAKRAAIKKNLAAGNKERIKKGKFGKGTKRNVQMQNKVGSCDLQLKTRVLKLSEKLGRLPTTKELNQDSSLYSLIYPRFGSYANALAAWGIDAKLVAEKDAFSKAKRREAHAKANQARAMHSKDSLLRAVKLFAAKHGRAPRSTDLRRRDSNLPHYSNYYLHFGNRTMEVIEKACRWTIRIARLKKLINP